MRAFSPEERADAVNNRILKLAEDTTIAVERIRIDDKPLTTNLTLGTLLLFAIIFPWFYRKVSYQVNAFTHNPSIMARIYSELYQNIQDKCNEAGIEILSPHYSAVRDGSQITIPEDYLPKNYTTPGWGIFPQGNILDLLNNKTNNSNQNQTKESKE